LLGSSGELALSTQCKLLKVTRSVVYARQKHLLKVVDEHECLLLQLLDEEYTRHPFYGSRRMTAYLCKLGHRDANVRLGRYGAWSQYQ
jgi:putative transposase